MIISPTQSPTAVVRYFELAHLIVEDTDPDGTPEEHASTMSLLIRTFITDQDAYYAALRKYLPEECV